MTEKPQLIVDAHVHMVNARRGSRLRISKKLIDELGWSDGSYEMWGLFRSSEELLCAPSNYVCEDGKHPFNSVFELIDIDSPSNPPKVEDIPSLRLLSAAERIFIFEATFTPQGGQLDLRLGVKNIERLLNTEVNKDNISQIVAITWKEILVLSSLNNYLSVLNQDFTNGLLNT